MFVNFRLEVGVSNYLVFLVLNWLFGYLEDVVVIMDSGGDVVLEFYRILDLGFIYYDLLVYLKNNLVLKVSYWVGEILFFGVIVVDFKVDMDDLFYLVWICKWFLF